MKSTSKYQSNSRSRSGKTLLSSLVIFLIVLSALGILAFSFLRLGINAGKKFTPVQETALTCAEAIAKIVVNTEEFGFVSIANLPPNGTAALAADGYSLPVRSINDIIATIRLDFIVADALEQPLMKEFALSDYRKMVVAKEKLINTLQEAIKKGGSATDRNGRKIEPYKVALQTYREASGISSGSGNSPKTEKGKKANTRAVALTLKLGSLTKASPTSIKVPEPITKASLKSEQYNEGYYLSYVNLPYDDKDFVLGGIGKKTRLIEPEIWTEEVEELPYQIPTIIKVEISKGKNEKESACAQPSSDPTKRPVPGALTISFPDGPPPEIKHPGDIYENKQLNSPEFEPMKLSSSRGGDYPVDSGSFLDNFNWPLNQVSNWESTANVWRLALYDWIRRAGPEANIDSIVRMQKVELDMPKPANLLWKAPLIHGGDSVTLQPISSGIVHIFKFDKDGIIDYESKIITPYPLYPSSENQLFGQGIAALTYSEAGEQTIHLPTVPTPKKIVLKAAFDAYIRDSVRIPGSISGGRHGGEPIAMPVLSAKYQTPTRLYDREIPYFVISPVVLNEEEEESTARIYNKGKQTGYQPTIAPQSDVGDGSNPKPPFVRPMPFGRGARPLYRVSGTAVDIRFRRQIDVSELNDDLSTGYFGIVKPDDE